MASVATAAEAALDQARTTLEAIYQAAEKLGVTRDQLKAMAGIEDQ